MRRAFLALATLGLLFVGADSAMARPVHHGGGGHSHGAVYHGGHNGNHVYVSPYGAAYYNGHNHYSIGVGWGALYGGGYYSSPGYYSYPPAYYSSPGYYYPAPAYYPARPYGYAPYTWSWWLGW